MTLTFDDLAEGLGGLEQASVATDTQTGCAVRRVGAQAHGPATATVRLGLLRVLLHVLVVDDPAVLGACPGLHDVDVVLRAGCTQGDLAAMAGWR